MSTPESKLQEKFPIKTPYQIPTLMPDEYWIGYLGRLLMVNSIRHIRDFGSINKFLNSLLSEKYSDYLNYHLFLKIACISQTKVEILVQQHSLIPFLRQANIKIRRPSNWHGEYKALACRFIKKDVYFCESCITEDINNYGVTYWRTSHQLPGINWCLKHKSPLNYLNKKNAMHSPPDTYLKKGIYTECFISEEIKQNPIVKKFTQTVQYYAENSFELNTRNLAKLLSQKAYELNLVKNRKDHGKFVSDFLIEEAPSCWRMEHFPDLNKTNEGQFLDEFDYALLTRKPVKKINLLLIISALFPSDINALLEVAKYDELHKKVPETVFSEEEILTAYINNYGQAKKIAKEINCSYKTTVRWLVYFGFFPLEAIGKRTIDALIAFNQGFTMEKIISMQDVNLKHLLLITHPDIKGMKQILNNLKNTIPIV